MPPDSTGGDSVGGTVGTSSRMFSTGSPSMVAFSYVGGMGGTTGGAGRVAGTTEKLVRVAFSISTSPVRS